ncbi:MAG TPA: S8 family peptidase, partial [Bacilli bacterium]
MMQLDKLNHIEIMRENTIREYKFNSNPAAPKPPLRNRQLHGGKIKTEFENTNNLINSQRAIVGIEPGKLLILNLSSNSMSPIMMNNMISKFNLSLIEEVQDTESSNILMLVQFADLDSISSFKSEQELWMIDSPVDRILKYAQRRDIFSCIESIRSLRREDRTGPRLKRFIESGQPFAEGFFIADIDVWHNGDRTRINETERIIKTAIGTTGSSLLGDLLETPSLLLGRVKINEFSIYALLDLDIVASIDLPFKTVPNEISELLSHDFEPIFQNELGENAPLVTVLDSGVFSAHPLLKDLIVGEEDFDLTERSTSDFNGHGTGVAGIVVYGDFHDSIGTKIFRPLVRICNAKIMHDFNGSTSFIEEKRPEMIVKDAIEYFYKEYNCRIFNLSAGNSELIYNNGRQFPWAEILDGLVRELDIVIVISAGNVSWPVINEFQNRDQFISNNRNQLFTKEHRLIDPATASLCITVGSISRFDEPEDLVNRPVRIAAGPPNSPSAFTRIGKGISKAIKPEFVDFGGNFAVQQIAQGDNRWFKNDKKLMEATIHHTNEKFFKGYCGTSFAAPRVTHLAARIERELELQIGEKPTANLIRAILVNSAKITEEMKAWAESSVDAFDTRNINAKQERRLRLLGYGIASDSALYSGRNKVTLFSEDSLNLRSFHLYKIPVPKEFLEIRSYKNIAISLAYNPVTRLSRKDYLANNLWFEVYRRIDEQQLAEFKTKRDAGENIDIPPVPNSYRAAFSPGYTEVDSSTLQNRVWSKGADGGSDLLWDIEVPYIWVLVAGKERFKYSEQELSQNYSLVVTFNYG